MTDAELKASAEAFVNEHWEEIIEDIRYLVQVESVENLSLAEPGKPWGPKSYEALRRGLEIAERLGLKTTDETATWALVTFLVSPKSTLLPSLTPTLFLWVRVGR